MISPAGPASANCPAYITMIRAHNSRTRAMLWVINKVVNDNSACNDCSNSTIWACTVSSKAVVGSSPISRAGLRARAKAISTRCRCPPDS